MTIDLDTVNNDALSYLLELQEEAMNRTEEDIESGNYVPVFIIDAFYFIPEEELNKYENALKNYKYGKLYRIT